MQLRSNLQMACCFYCLQKYSVSKLKGWYKILMILYSKPVLIEISYVVMNDKVLDILQKACELVLNVIKDLPYTHDRVPACNSPDPSGTKGRQLWLTKCTESEILPYCIHLLRAALKVWLSFFFIWYKTEASDSSFNIYICNCFLLHNTMTSKCIYHLIDTFATS
jgi:hypothetical protein